MSRIGDFVVFVCELLSLAIFIRVILSWFSIRQGNPVVIILYKITEPILGPLRKIIPRMGMFDITPLAAIVLLRIIRALVS